MEFNAIAAKENQQPKKKRRSFFSKERQFMSGLYPDITFTDQGFLKVGQGDKPYYMAMFNSRKYDLRYLSEPEGNQLMDAYWDLHKKYTKSFKEIYTTTLEDNKKQQEYFQYKIERTTEPTLLFYLQEELDLLKYIEATYEKFSTYPCIFGETEAELLENVESFKSLTRDFLDVTVIPKSEVKKVLYGLNNRFGGKLNTEAIEDDESDVFEVTKPQGGLSFKNESYNVTGDGASTCLHVIAKPNVFPAFWIDNLVRRKDVFAIVDSIYFEDNDYLHIIENSVEETIASANKARTQTGRDSLEKETMILRELYQEVDSNGERIKNVHIRFYLRERSVEKLQKKVEELLKELGSRGFGATVFLDEQKEEWQSMLLPFDRQLQLPSRREGLAFPSEALGVGFGYNQTNLSDPSAKYYGFTSSGGTIYWDIFHKTNKRLSYNGILLGDMGSGKSTLLKTIVKDNLQKGNYVRGFDKAGELDKLIREFNGVKINLDGTEGSINILEVFPVSTANPTSLDDLTISPEASFNAHISLLGKKYATYNKEASSNEVTKFTSIARSFYKQKGYLDHPDKNILEFEANEYPILEDLRDFNLELKEKETEPTDREYMASIDLNLSSMVDDFGAVFNRHTTIENLGEQQFVIFDISSLASLGEKAFDIQFFSAMTIIQQNLMTLGRNEKFAFDNKQKHWWDIKRSLIVNDECQNTLNVKKLTALEMYTILMSEGRKFFIGLLNATQKAERFYPSMGNVSDADTANAASKLQEIIGLSQYKIVLKQDETSLPALKKIFGNTFTDAEYNVIPNFYTDQTGSRGILSIAGDQNLQVTFEVTKEEIALFDGGA